MADARRQGGTAETSRAHHPERVTVFDGEGRGTLNQAEGGVLTWNAVKLSMTSLWLSTSPSFTLPGPSRWRRKDLGYNGKERGHQRHTHLYHGNPYERAEKKQQKMLSCLRKGELCQESMGTGIHGPVNR